MSVALALLLVLIAFASGWLLARRARPATASEIRGLPAAAAAVDAAEQAAARERERIYADLHDDLGARLLELIYSAPNQATADLGRAILQDLRDVVSRSRSEPGTLLDVLASIRAEASQRLASAGAELQWEAPDDLPDPPLDQATALHLHRIVREAISNAIRHAHARRLRARVAVGKGPELRLELTDEGGLENPDLKSSGGSGVQNMRARAEALQGEIDWAPGTLGGTKVLLRAPLPPMVER